MRRGARWRLANLDRVRERKREHYLKNKNKYLTLERDRQYRVRYGITLADYNRMLLQQGGKCAICGSDKEGKVGQCFAVDHNHDTGTVRGLLCIRCNARLGWFEQHQSEVMNYLLATAEEVA